MSKIPSTPTAELLNLTSSNGSSSSTSTALLIIFRALSKVMSSHWETPLANQSWKSLHLTFSPWKYVSSNLELSSKFYRQKFYWLWRCEHNKKVCNRRSICVMRAGEHSIFAGAITISFLNLLVEAF